MTTSKSKLEVIAPANEPVIITRRFLMSPLTVIRQDLARFSGLHALLIRQS